MKGKNMKTKLIKKIRKKIKMKRVKVSPIKEISVPQRGIILKNYPKKKEIKKQKRSAKQNSFPRNFSLI